MAMSLPRDLEVDSDTVSCGNETKFFQKDDKNDVKTDIQAMGSPWRVVSISDCCYNDIIFHLINLVAF